jgi:hypothetical protein
VRGAYGNLIMFSMLGSMAGIALSLTNPITLVFGAVMGGKGIREQRERQRDQRRAHAKAAVRRFVDEVSFRVGKEKSDGLRRLHRELRDSFMSLAAELQRSATDGLNAAQRAVTGDQDARKRRIGDMNTALQTLAALRSEAEQLATPAPAG